MKTFYITTMIVVSFLISSNRIQAQIVNSNLDQHKEMQQFVGTWQRIVSKDAVKVSENKQYGEALIENVHYTIKDKESVFVPAVKLDSILWDVYYADSGKFKNCEKWIYQYNEQLDPSLATYYWYNSITNEYLPQYKFELTYNPSGIPKEGIIYQWDLRWIKYLKRDYEYDSVWNLTQEIYSLWQDPIQQWYYYVKYDYHYDSTGNIISAIETAFDYSQNWINFLKDEYTYDSSNYLKMHNHYFWYNTLNCWLVQESNEYEYSSTGYTVISTFNAYEEASIVVTYKYKHEYTFDENSNLSSYLLSSWDQYNNQWNYVRKKIYTYDNAYDRNDIIMPTNNFLNENSIFNDFKFDVFNHMLVEMTCDFFWDDNWTHDSRAIFYYSDITQSNLSEPDLVRPVIYPNPATDYIFVSWDNYYPNLNLEIYDIYGHLVLYQLIVNEVMVSIKNLTKGLYLIKLRNNNDAIYTGRIIIQ